MTFRFRFLTGFGKPDPLDITTLNRYNPATSTSNAETLIHYQFGYGPDNMRADNFTK